MRHKSVPAADRRILVATGNAGKLREMGALLGGLGFEILGQGEAGLPAVEETGDTFVANALLKARHAAAATGIAVIADDSGLEVDALGGAPGVFSARYAGEGANDEANNAKLAAALADVPLAHRRARYRCALVYLPAPPDSAPIVTEGVWEGLIATAPRGGGGFGYDPYFLLPDLQRTAAELDPEVKNRISHRAMAMRALRERLAARRA